ncbi:hypothetical protein RhiJN_15346 [Ceratobasidium sp. AG-Ba]|nr:hypothetical protein RhiJN_15346 [Ceratobasidium sp. AG-Ba]
MPASWMRRLYQQRSLEALRSTQKQLQEATSEEETPDPDLEQAFRENSVVIASQEERILMLRKALEVQGAAIADNPHYDIQQPPQQSLPPAGPLPQVAASAPPNEDQNGSPNFNNEDSEGIYL